VLREFFKHGNSFFLIQLKSKNFIGFKLRKNQPPESAFSITKILLLNKTLPTHRSIIIHTDQSKSATDELAKQLAPDDFFLRMRDFFSWFNL